MRRNLIFNYGKLGDDDEKRCFLTKNVSLKEVLTFIEGIF